MMDEIEKKKWIISRADHTFNLRRQMIREQQKEIEQFRESEVSRWKKVETGTISTVVASIGIVVGLHEIYPTAISWGFPLLIISVTGLAVYLPSIILRYINEKIFGDIVSSNQASNVWHFSYGCFTRYATNIEQYSSNDFKKFLDYFDKCVSISAELSLYLAFKRHSSWLKLMCLSMTAVRKMIDSKKQYQGILNFSSKNYEVIRKEYESIPIIADFLPYGNALSRYSNGIMIPPEPRVVFKAKKDNLTKLQDSKKFFGWVKNLKSRFSNKSHRIIL